MLVVLFLAGATRSVLLRHSSNFSEMHPPIFLLRCFVLIGLLATAQVVNAEPAKEYPPCMSNPTKSDVEVAQGAYSAGHVSFEEADYRRALLYWEDAFRRDCTAVKLLLSLARAYELSEDPGSAALALETYLKRVPETEKRPSLEKRIARLRSQVRSAPPANPQASDPKQHPMKGSPPLTSESEASTRKPIWPILVTGAGVTLALVGHGILQNARHEVADLGCDPGGDNCPSDDAEDTASETTKDARRIGVPLAVSGHVLGAVGGVLWYYLWTRPVEKSSAQVLTPLEPVFTSNYQGVRYRATF